MQYDLDLDSHESMSHIVSGRASARFPYIYSLN